MKTQHFNNLTEPEQERLVILIEEATEVAQVGCKILRHGYESDNRGKLLETNRKSLERELSDLLWSFTNMGEHGDIDQEVIEARSRRGKPEALPYIHHNNK